MPSDHWTSERIGRLGFLIGIGWDAKRVADDPAISSTPNNVYQRAKEFGLSFREARALSMDLPPEAHNRFGNAAARRGLTREALARLLLLEIATDPSLIDNILDDRDDEIAA